MLEILQPFQPVVEVLSAAVITFMLHQCFEYRFPWAILAAFIVGTWLVLAAVTALFVPHDLSAVSAYKASRAIVLVAAVAWGFVESHILAR